MIHANGKDVARDDLKDKLIGVYFAAEWFPPCRKFTTDLVNFYAANKGDIEIVFVSGDRGTAAQKKFMTGYKMPWLHLENNSAESKALKSRYAVKSLPQLIILGKNGQVISKDGRKEVQGNAAGAVKKWKERN